MTDDDEARHAARLLTAAGFLARASGPGGNPFHGASCVTMRSSTVMALLARLGSSRPGTVRLLITSNDGLVARIEDYDGPVPQVGDALLHPPLDDDGTSDMTFPSAQVAGTVRTVFFGVHGRPQAGEEHFTGRAVRIVQVCI